MNIADVRAFVALADSGSVNRAARLLNLSQPALTRRLQNFEAAIGRDDLLDRTTKPPRLTPVGHQVLGDARRVLRAMSDLQASDDTSAGEFRFGVAHGLVRDAVASALDDLNKQFPRLKLQIFAKWTADMLRDLPAGRLDCALGLLQEPASLPRGIQSSAVAYDDLVVVASSASHRERRSVRLADLSEERWILNPAGCGFRAALARAFERENLTPVIAAEVMGDDMQLALAARGLGLALVPRRTYRAYSNRRALTVLRVDDLDFSFGIRVLKSGPLGRMESVVSCLLKSLSREMPKATI